MNMFRLPKLIKHQQGFSLPEVTIAVAIAALGIISILGLMPQGLEMSRKTGQISAHRQIVEQIIRDLDQTDWANLPGASVVVTKYFDDQGLELATASAPTMSYIVKYNIAATNPKLPSLANAPPAAEAYLKNVTIKIATTVNSNFDFSNANQKSYNTFTHFLAKGK